MKKSLVLLLLALSVSVEAAPLLRPDCVVDSNKKKATKPMKGYVVISKGTIVLFVNELGYRHICRLPTDAYPLVEERQGRWVAYHLGGGRMILDESGAPFELKVRSMSDYN